MVYIHGTQVIYTMTPTTDVLRRMEGQSISTRGTLFPHWGFFTMALMNAGDFEQGDEWP